jgi:sigma-B regulation protein RsbU (phosphoserine phosphatase)
MSGSAMVLEDRREWTAARDVQQRFTSPIPHTDAVDYSATCRQIGSVGGDCCDLATLPGGVLALTVGDASGKGLPAALMIAHVQSSLRTAAQFTSDGAATVAAVNRHVHATSLADRYATLFHAVIDPHSRTLRYVNAGHVPPFVLRRHGSVEWLETGGAPVGLFPDWRYEEGSVELESGDFVVACTDGVTEVEDPSGEIWGMEGLQRAAAQYRGQSAAGLAEAIFQSMDRFSDGTQTDDATVAVLRIR